MVERNHFPDGRAREEISSEQQFGGRFAVLGHKPILVQAAREGFCCIEGNVRLTLDGTWLLVAQQGGPESSGSSRVKCKAEELCG